MTGECSLKTWNAVHSGSGTPRPVQSLAAAETEGLNGGVSCGT